MTESVSQRAADYLLSIIWNEEGEDDRKLVVGEIEDLEERAFQLEERLKAIADHQRIIGGDLGKKGTVYKMAVELLEVI